MLAKLYYLICDACGVPSSDGEDDARTARQMARRAGWTRRPGAQHAGGDNDGKDFCRKCTGNGAQ